MFVWLLVNFDTWNFYNSPSLFCSKLWLSSPDLFPKLHYIYLSPTYEMLNSIHGCTLLAIKWHNQKHTASTLFVIICFLAISNLHCKFYTHTQTKSSQNKIPTQQFTLLVLYLLLLRSLSGRMKIERQFRVFVVSNSNIDRLTAVQSRYSKQLNMCYNVMFCEIFGIWRKTPGLYNILCIIWIVVCIELGPKRKLGQVVKF